MNLVKKSFFWIEDLIKKKITLSHHRRAMIHYIETKYNNNNNGGGLLGVEIGVKTGLNAQYIMYNLPIKKLFLVDSYCFYDGVDEVYEWDSIRDEAHRRLKKFGDKVEFVESFSHDAVSVIPGGLDFVYIDGNHDYKFIKRDIELYYPKIKNGGLLGGHDFSIVELDVVRAVLDFVDENNLVLHGRTKDWWVFKQENGGGGE